MGLAYVLSLVGILCAGVGLTMLAPMGVALIYGESGWSAFAGGGFISLLLGGALFWLFRDNTQRELSHRQGMAIVGISWAVAGVLGGLPFYLTGDFASFTDAVFESISGFTTTGASILTNVEAAQKCVLFWRALTHWLGGMGFIVLSEMRTFSSSSSVTAAKTSAAPTFSSVSRLRSVPLPLRMVTPSNSLTRSSQRASSRSMIRVLMPRSTAPMATKRPMAPPPTTTRFFTGWLGRPRCSITSSMSSSLVTR